MMDAADRMYRVEWQSREEAEEAIGAVISRE